MKISEDELIAYIEEIRHQAKDVLDRRHAMKIPQNTAGTGLYMGVIETCDEIIKVIKEGLSDL